MFFNSDIFLLSSLLVECCLSAGRWDKHFLLAFLFNAIIFRISNGISDNSSDDSLLNYFKGEYVFVYF
uniref:Putative secreted protein n=1 Tax=Xenopsylla cheopis TaxID=163159 RepID=A0A6M2DZG3_XENCH